MSRASSSRRGVYVEGPKNDVFTALLVVALLAIIFACLLLVLEWGTYDFKTSPTGGMRGMRGTTTALAIQSDGEAGLREPRPETTARLRTRPV